MWISNANSQISAFENPKYVLNEWTLISRLNADLIKVVNSQRDTLAKWSFNNDGPSIEPIVRAQISGRHGQRFE